MLLTPRKGEGGGIHMVSREERNGLEKLYEGRRVYHGELHDHSDSGGTSDGKCPLGEWPEKMRALLPSSGA